MGTCNPVYCVIAILLLVTSCDSSSPEQQNKDLCTAGVLFLRTFSGPNSLTPPPRTEVSPAQENNTYTIQISYPCDTSPLHKIEKLRERVKDPFVSFYLKKHRTRRVKRLTEYGSGDYDDDDDDEDDDDEEEEEDEELDTEFGKSVEPSNHVVVLLPTPSVIEIENTLGVDGPSSRYQPPELTSSIVLESITPTRSYYPSHSVNYRITTEDENLLFPNLGSGDGPLVMTTPIYNPTDQTYSSSSSSPPYYSSSFTPTPALSAHLLHPIPKQMISSGIQHRLVIPLNTFQPPCYEYELLEHENWVDVKRNVVNFFPVTSHISDYTFRLECKDHGGVADMFVSVRQRQKSRLHNHAFVLEFGMIRGNHSRVEILGKLVDEVKSVLGSVGNGSDLVIVSTELDTYPFRVSYVNETIISNVCPIDEMKAIYDKLGNVNGFIKMESVKVTIPPDNNQCDSGVVGVVTGEKSVTGYGENYPPSIKNQIDRLNGSVGEYLVFGVREDFCYDPEDGGTRNLKVQLMSIELTGVEEDYWLQFDGKNQEFFGLPMATQEREFVLVCSDSGGKSANDVFELQILPPRVPSTTYNTEFSLHFESIPFTPKAIRKFIEKLTQILDNQIQVHSYSKWSESNKHVLFKWFNTSNPSNEHDVTEIRKVLLSDDGPVSKRLYEHFSPEFNVSVASVVPLRGLLSENNPVDEMSGGGKEEGGRDRYFDFDGGEVVGGGGGDGKVVEGVANVDSYSGYLTTYIIPSVLIAVMILLALIIACLLSRKNKYTQASTEDDSPNARVYLKNAKKGVPVIFQDELDEKLFGNGGQAGHRGNIYEPPRSGMGTPNTNHPPPPRVDSSSTGMQSPRVLSPQPTNPRGYSAPPNPPPNYENSISRRNHRPPPVGGYPVFPNQHYDRTPQHHPHQRIDNADSYAPPPGINYYGIRSSNSGGSGFSQASGMGTGQYTPGGHHGNKMAPPPYVPP